MKKTLFLLLTLIAPVWAVGQSFSGSGSGTSSDPYLVFNPIQLDQIRNFLDQSGVYFKLMADIDMDEYIADNNPTYGWQPIGTDGERFKGILDGNNKTISNIWINRSTTDYVGFFGYTDHATVKDLTLVYKSGKNCVGKNETGLVIGRDYGSIITNVSASISSTVGLSSAFDVGGFIGYSSGSKISNCSVTAQYVVASRTCGGFVGYSSGSTFSNNTVTASVRSTSSSSYDLGGFVGSNTNGTFTNCVSTQASNTGTYGHVYGGYQLGGFVGSTSSGTFSSCSANGKVTSLSTTNGKVGGFIGSATGPTTTGCSAFGGVNAKAGNIGGFIGYAQNPKITSCGAHGEIIGADDYVGGIVGYVTSPKMTSCYMHGDIIEGKSYVGGIAGYLSNQSGTDFLIKNSYVVSDLNSEGNYIGGLVGQINSTAITYSEPSSYTYEESYSYTKSNIHFWNGAQTDYTESGSFKSPSSFTIGQSYQGKRLTTISVISNGHNGSASDRYYSNSVKYQLEAINTGAPIVIKVSNTKYQINDTSTFAGYKIIAVSSPMTITTCSMSYSERYGLQVNSSTYTYKYKEDGAISSSTNDTYNYCYTCMQLKDSSSSNEQISNNFFSGNIKGASYVGGCIGKMQSDFCQVSKNLVNSNKISAYNYTGGIYGAALTNNTSQVSPTALCKQNAAIVFSLNSVNSAVGRIYGSSSGYSIGASGTSERNYALTTCRVSVNGVEQTIADNLQNGDSRGASTLKYAATYQGIGWDFNNDWSIQETESYPYNPAQTAPPVIQSTPVSGGTTLSGKATTGSTVYVVIGSNTYQTTAANNAWSVTVPAMQSGASLYAYAKATDKDYSYHTPATVGFAGSGTEKDPYQIYTATDLANINSASYYKLMNDIDLTSYINANSPTDGWIPLGRSAATPVSFDGDGHTISGLWTNTTADYTGLFATLTNATVKNLTIKVNTAKQVKGGSYTGILAGKTNSCTFTDIAVEGTVSSAGNYVGGMTGRIWGGGSSSRISASVNVSGQDYVGGITGQNYGNPTDQSFATGSVTGKNYVGGLFGHVNCSVTNNSFDGNVTASEGYAGGISGYAMSYISTCKSSGSIISNGTGANSIAGGIVGYTTASISNCYSTANTTAYQYAAGITGYSTAAVSNCYSSGNITASNVAAGVVGYNDGSTATIHNCVALNPTLSVSLTTGYGMRVLGGYKNEAPTPTTDNFALKSMALSVNGISQQIYDDLLNGTSYVADNFKVASFYTNLGWDFSTVWGIDEGTGYPYLAWEYMAEAITLNKEAITIKAGTKETLTVTVSPTEAAGVSITWSSSNNEVATVDNGVITAVAPGSAIITAAANDGSEVTATCSVTVTKNLDAAIANLQAYVDSAQTICDNAVEGIYLNEYVPGAKTALQSVINEVSATISATMSEESITQGTTKLDAALAEFESKRVTSPNIDYSIINDIIYINNVSSASDTQITVPVILNNSNDISDIQFDIVLPAGVTIAKDEDDFELIEVGDRTTVKKHSIDCLEQSDGSVRVMCTSSKGYTFEGNAGTALLITLDLGQLGDGDYILEIKNCISSNADNTYHLPNTAATISIVNFVLGDINSDGNINVGDLSRLVKMILNDYTTIDNIFRAADINGDSQLNVGDYSKLVQMILNAPVAGSKAFHGSALSKSYMAGFSTMEAEDVNITSDRAKQIAIRLNNNGGKFNALQFDVTLPEGLQIDENATETAARTSGFDVTTNGKRVILSNIRDKAIDGEEGIILYLGLKADYGLVGGTNKIEFNNVLLSTVNSEVVKANDFSSAITEEPTGINNVPSSILDTQSIYDLQGRKVKSTSGKGIFIINKKKINTK